MPFSNEAPPVRAGDYSRFVTQRTLTVPPAPGQTLAMPIVDDWGPDGEVIEINSFAEYLQKFGTPVTPGNYSPGFIAAYNAFRGEGNDAPGAGSLLLYRMTGSSGAAAHKTLAAGATDPALTLTAKYKGTRGNNLKVEVVVNATTGTKRDVRIYDGAVKIEEYKSYGSADIVALAAAINANANSVVVASGATDGTVLDALAAASFTGGNSGTTLTSTQWTNAYTALEPKQFGYFVPFDLTDGTIKTAIAAWANGLNNREKAKRFFTVFGGLTGESFSTAATEAATYGDENVVRFGCGTYNDSQLDQNLSTSQLAPRIAGIMAARGGTASLSMARLDDLTIVAGPSESEVLSAYTSGVLVACLGVAGNVHLESSRTTFQPSQDSNLKPFSIYSRIKYVTTMQSFERDVRVGSENGNVIGRLPVNNDTREHIVSDAQKVLDDEYVRTKQIQKGAQVMIASDPPPSDDDEFIAIDYVGKFGRTAEQIRRTFYLS